MKVVDVITINEIVLLIERKIGRNLTEKEYLNAIIFIANELKSELQEG